MPLYADSDCVFPDASVTELRGYIEQLTGHGLLRQTGEDYPVLELTAGNKTTPGVNNSQWSFTGLNWAGVATNCF